MIIKQFWQGIGLTTLLLTLFTPLHAEPVTPKAVIQTYANIAYANYSDSLSTAKILQDKIKALIAKPSEQTQQDAKQAWLSARQPYGQTEVFRFGNPNVDQWEGQVNAWPLDEGLIDYVNDDLYDHEEGNRYANANIIASKEPLTAELLKSYQEKGGSEANVATGYHAIEFLLWGQDLNEKPNTAGQRPYTDYVSGSGCTHSNCERRAQYLQIVTDLLVSDLQTMVEAWSENKKDNYRAALLAVDEKEALRRMLFGMGSLSLGELAGQRMNVALLANSQEDEHSCFSDNTHSDIAANAQGIQNIYTGTYKRVDGSTLSGASLAQLLANQDNKLSQLLLEKLSITQQKAAAIVAAADKGEAFDQQIAPENKAGNERVQATIEALRSQTAEFETMARILGIEAVSTDRFNSLGG